MAQNCWEFKKCGREPGGPKVDMLGVCKASTEPRLTGVNDGRFGGRACWAIAGTLCGGVVQGTFAAKLANCMSCDFYRQVDRDQGASMLRATAILEKLR